MSTSMNDERTLRRLVADLRETRIDRRAFATRAAQLGLAAPIATALATVATRPGLAAPALSLQMQDGGKTLVAAIPQATVQLDPAIAGSNGYGDIIPITDNITEGLTRFKPGTVEIEPALAESWQVSDDGLEYVFTIRPGVTFHDGTPLDAKAVETNFLRQFDESNPLHQDAMVYSGIVFADVESIAATGDMELTIRLSRPTILLPGNLAIFAAGIVSPTALEAEGADFGQQPVGTGPFTFESWTKDVELVLVANDDYWGGPPALERVVWRTIAEDTVRLSELQTGAIDVANQIDFKDAGVIEDDPNLQLITGPFLNVQFLAMNQALAPFDNASLRKAVQHAINKEAIALVVSSGRYTLGAGPIAPALLGYDASLADAYPYDPEQARALLEESGLSDISFDLYNRANTFWPTLGQLVQADLDAIGITVSLQTLEDAEFFDQLATGQVPAFLNDWTWDNGDPDNVMSSLFTGDRATSRLGYDDEETTDLILRAQEEADPNARAALYVEAQQRLLDDAVAVFLGYPERAIGAQAAVRNLLVSPVGSVVLREVDLVESTS
jgi:peptide/nickel transport system substrate-binding protein